MSDKQVKPSDDMSMGALIRREERAKNALSNHKEGVAIEAQRLETMTRYTVDRDLVNQLVGRAHLAATFSKIGNMSSLVALRKVKENKLYQSLSSSPLQSITTGEMETVSTWADFCEHCIGMTSRHIDEQLRNLKDFGADALESMQQVGLGYRDMRNLRQLPEADRAVVLGEIDINIGDKEAIVELIESQAAKHAREKVTLEKRSDDLQSQLEASRKMTAEKNDRIDELAERLHLSEAMKPDERAQELLRRLQEATRSAFNGLLIPHGVFNLIAEWEDAPKYLLDARGMCLGTIYHELMELQRKFVIPDVKFDIDDLRWMDEADGSRPPFEVSDCLPSPVDPDPTGGNALSAADQRFPQGGLTGETKP